MWGEVRGGDILTKNMENTSSDVDKCFILHCISSIPPWINYDGVIKPKLKAVAEYSKSALAEYPRNLKNEVY